MMREQQLGQTQLTNSTATSVYAFGILTSLDVNTIDFQRVQSKGGIVRYTFNGTPDLSSVKVGYKAVVSSSTNSSNNGTFHISAVDDTNDYIEVFNPNRSDTTDDEATDSPSVVSIKPAVSVDIKSVRIVNETAGSITADVYHDDDGTTYSSATIIATQVIPANDYITITDIFSDDPLMNVAVKSSDASGNLTVTVYGALMNTP